MPSRPRAWPDLRYIRRRYIQAAVAANDDAVQADVITSGRYACYAQFGGGSSRQVGRTGGGITKEIHADGTWRDTSYGSMTATNPAYGGT